MITKTRTFCLAAALVALSTAAAHAAPILVEKGDFPDLVLFADAPDWTGNTAVQSGSGHFTDNLTSSARMNTDNGTTNTLTYTGDLTAQGFAISSAGQQVTLQFDLGNRLGDNNTAAFRGPANVTANILVNGVALGTQLFSVAGDGAGAVIPDGTFQTYSLSYTTMAADIGQPLGIQFSFNLPSGTYGTNGAQTAVDNVAMEVSAVPEPASLALLGLGGLLLTGRRRRA